MVKQTLQRHSGRGRTRSPHANHLFSQVIRDPTGNLLHVLDVFGHLHPGVHSLLID
jgi:hypothetical protein